MKKLMMFLAALALAACAQDQSHLRITASKPEAAPVLKPRSEPIFYNGKTYQLDLNPTAQGEFSLVVNGMGPKQEKDAVNLATSSLRYYACKDSQTSRLRSRPAYADGRWTMAASCG
jgi:hypothetical protein